ncbi:MAG TPA: response regulator transcription factor [Candidatus Polarisedimenticolaceae bacterium]|nr:response regulator transcription factor [Candidatus Polarisedimenticolaceae bacterium]
MKRIVIIEDDADIALSIKYSMEREGEFAVTVARDGEAGIEAATRSVPDLVLLDLNLPGLDGTEVCRVLRSNRSTSAVPIIMLTARVEEREKVTGLDLGADDYITKPFSIREVLARVRAVLRRSAGGSRGHKPLAFGPLTLDEARRRVTVDGEEIRLTRKEFDLLADLMRRPDLVLTRELLLARVWGYDHPGATRTVDVHIRQLRKKLGQAAARYIETVVGVGYRFRGDPA